MGNKEDRLLGGENVAHRKGGFRKPDLGDGKDGGEEQIGGGQIAQENPGRDFAAKWAGPDGLVQAFEILGVERIGDPCDAAGDEVEGEGGDGGTEKQGREATMGECLADEENGNQGEAGAREIQRVGGVTEAERESHRPHREWNGKAAPAGCEQGTAEKQRAERLEIRLGLGKHASQHTKRDDESDD